MEIRQLKYFLAIADCGSLSKAAQKVYIAQSALSKQLAELEDELGVQLLHRTRMGVSVTESGKVFYEYAQAVIKQLADARVAVLNSVERVTGSVVVAIPQSVSTALSLPLIMAAKRKLPGITLHLDEELTGHIVEQLQYGRTDLAIMSSNVPLPDFLTMNLAVEKMVLVHAPDMQVGATAGSIRLEDALKLPLVMSSATHSHAMRAFVERAVEEKGLSMPSPVMEINSVNILKSAVIAGTGCTIMPAALVADQIAGGLLLARDIVDPPLERTLVLCASSAIPMSNAKRAVAQLVKDVIVDLCESGRWPDARPDFDGYESFMNSRQRI